MNTLLAHESQRAYVFQDYYWKGSYHPWLIPPITFSETRRHPQTPLSALISGPSSGGPWEPNDSAPRSVSARYWEVVCPKEKRKVYYTRDIKPFVPKPSPESLARSPYSYAGGPIGNNQRENWESPWGDDIFAFWRDLLLNSMEQCIEIIASQEVDFYPQTFDVRMWATHKALPLWEMFSNSSVSRLLSASPLVKSGVDRNLHLFEQGSKSGGDGSVQAREGDPLLDTLAIHVRLGDFSDACVNLLAAYNLTFYSWNLLPSLSPEDVFIPPPGGVLSPDSTADEAYVYGKNTEENTKIYLDRCQPSIDQVAQKVQAVRDTMALDLQIQLHTLYILTNSAPREVDALKEALRQHGGGWSKIVTSKDLVLDDFQRDVEGAVDMEIARRAGGFIGNGWSSMSSNIVHQRLVSGHKPSSVRFW
ncbi:hypothetical protein AAF712_008784 [Marasmius tenuissimus]|uniref:Uncharacterized protein n=1 Tax=Marasmius tenuissimus TaxID=585030 RepID=A0ABR2ZU88_9AGAR